MTCPCFPAFSLRLTLLLLLMMASGGQVLGQDTPDPCAEGGDLYKAAKYEQARLALRICLDASGPDVNVLLPLMVMGVNENRLIEAVEYGAAAVEVAPENAEVHYWYGRALLRVERTTDAKAQWETGLRAKSDHLGLLEGLARLALAENESAKAYQLFSQMQLLGVEQPWLGRLLADIAAGKGLWGQSLGHLKDAMALEGGGTARDLMTAAELSIMAGDKDGAVDLSRQAVFREPGPETYGGLGQAFFALDRLDSALVYLRLAVEQAPGISHFRFNLANALEVDGQVEEADFHFRTFLQQEPKDPVGYFNYAIHLEKMGRSAEALLSVDQAIILDPSMLTARVVRVQLLEGQGHWDDALAELAVLQSQDSANVEQLNTWKARLVSQRDQSLALSTTGKIHLQHMVLSTVEILEQVQAEMAAGENFTALVVRYSTGPAAAKGGDIGWVNLADMVLPIREGLAALGTNEISPPIESKGLYHIFKRIP